MSANWTEKYMIALSQTAKTARIRELNDAFRRTFSGGKVVMTAGVDALPDMVKAAALQKAATFDAFTDDNDPYGEHDFGSFEYAGKTIFWKIDLYEEPGVKSKNGEPVVNRVLTIMLADEY
jgi:Protein of unknown function (DUF3768)